MLPNFFDNKKFDKFLKGIFFVLILFNILLILLSITTHPKVTRVNLEQNFSSAQQGQILLTFNRNMDRRSVEQNFSISPKVEGKFSWNGRNFAFTPSITLSYGTEFQIKIKKAAHDVDGINLGKDFLYNFSTKALKFAYIGQEGEEKGKLIVSDLQGEGKEAFTDGKLLIDSFKIASDGQSIYFLASKENFFDLPRNELYFLNLESKKITQITDYKNYLNKSFTISRDGKYITLSRIEVAPDGQLLTRIELWLAKTEDYKFRKFLDGKATGSNVIFTPDSAYLIYRNKDSNFEITAIDPNQKEDPVFIGEYSVLYDIHPYKPLIALSKYDESDVFSVNNFLTLFQGDGTKEDVPFGKGIVRDTFFAHDGKALISIFSGQKDQLDDKDSFYPLRIFHLYFYDLQTKKLKKLTDDIDYSEENPVISPDNRYVLFLRYETLSGNIVVDPAYRDVADSLGSVNSEGQIWLMNLQTQELMDLKIKGTQLSFFP